MSKPDLVVFDLDGTLIDTVPAYGHMAITLLTELHGATHEEAVDKYLATIGRPFVEQLELMYPGHPSNLAALSQFEMFKADYQESIVGFVESLNACKALAKVEIPMAVVSSTTRALVTNLVKRCELSVYIKYTTGFDADSQLTKRRQLEIFQEKFGDIAFVGDTPYDAEVAGELDIRFLAVTHTFPRAHFEALGIKSTHSIMRAASIVQS